MNQKLKLKLPIWITILDMRVAIFDYNGKKLLVSHSIKRAKVVPFLKN